MLNKKCRIFIISDLRPGYKDYRELFESALLLETSPAEAHEGGESVGEVDLNNKRKLTPELKPSPLSVYSVNRSSVWIKPGYVPEMYKGDDLDL